MNHHQIYTNLISNSINENRIKHNGIYYENHHIIPKCINEDNNENNLVLLTAKEHYLAHKLLTFIYPNNRKIILALHMMMNVTRNFEKIKISSRDYVYLKELISKNGLSEEAKEKVSLFNKGKKLSEETKNKIRETHKGNKNPMFGKPAWDVVNKIKKTCKYCGITTNVGNYSRWHGKNCKHKF
jgi:hypothetical protein